MALIKINIDACKGCGLCAHACPKGIIVLDTAVINKKGYNPARCKDNSLCTGCASCARMCPDVCIEVER
jgi:2-oxoglutarate ferredoxin oxidoreductase subunit delta